MEFKAEELYFCTWRKEILQYVGSSFANWDMGDGFRFKFKVIQDGPVEHREYTRRISAKNIIPANEAQKVLFGSRKD